ncbi:hypothetical protein CAL65_17540 [Alkalilimnicola ehrlichii]|uniref:Response regulator receiver modulated diguanylate cyclase/phosphodiesterase with PAS/PAC sensor(S) n=2 Tax=Alkalilimnicola ehrlichii TaxID=351052 RepID=A0A3E0WKY0_9GAMM|nr:hypothetical protein CAL65_17540 [Alkalilimnicola ehrlichii]
MRILLVDDDAVDRRIVRRGLTRAGDDIHYEIIEAETGEEALQRLAESRFDCVLLDLWLPDVNGLELLGRLENVGTDEPVPVVMLTGQDDVATAVKAMRLGARDYLIKDVEGHYRDMMPAVVRRVRSGERLRQEARRAEAELRAAESRYRSLIEQIPAITFTMTLRGPGEPIFTSPQIRELGIDPEAWRRQPELFWKRVPASHRAQVRHAWVATRDHGEPLDEEFPFVRPDGNEVWLRAQARLVRAEGHAFVQGILTDITESHAVQAELQAHRERLEELVDERTAALNQLNQRLQRDLAYRRQVEDALFREKRRAEVTLQAIGDAVITLGADGRVDYVNPAAERLLNCAQGGMQGEPLQACLTFLHEEEERSFGLDELAAFAEEEEGAYCCRLRLRAGGELTVAITAAVVRDASGQAAGHVIGLRDVTEERAQARRLSHQARHDALTGLVNRAEFEHRLGRLLEQIDGQQHVLCLIDLDGFKPVNDTGGHAAGDELLRQLGRQLSRHVRQRDTLARLGGDEFACVFEHCSLKQGVGLAAELLEVVKNHSLYWQGRTYRVGASVGIVAVDGASPSVPEVVQQADRALYAAKAAGRGRIKIYERDVAADAAVSDPWQRRLIEALAREEGLRLFQQPIAHLGEQPYQPHFELLLRFAAVEGLLPATRFMPAAERFRLGPSLDHWVVTHAIDHMAAEAANTVYFVNVSEASLREGVLPSVVADRLHRQAVDPARLVLEIGETAALNSFPEAVAFAQEVKGLGCGISLDDFADGLPMMQQLSQLQPDFIKIRSHLIEQFIEDAIARALIQSIVTVGHAASAQTVAKWPREREDLRELQTLGVDHVQGNLIAPPYALGARAEPSYPH